VKLKASFSVSIPSGLQMAIVVIIPIQFEPMQSPSILKFNGTSDIQLVVNRIDNQIYAGIYHYR